MNRRTLVALLALATTAALAVPVNASAEPRGAIVRDVTGDLPSPELDIHTAVFGYNRTTGLLLGSVRLGAPPTAAVLDSVTFWLGRFSDARQGGCDWREDVSISTPDADDVEDGFFEPYVELFPDGDGQPAIGYLSSRVDGDTIHFTSDGTAGAVIDAVTTMDWNCFDLTTSYAGTFRTADAVDGVPLVDGPRPICELRRRRVKAGRALRATCRDVRGRVEIRAYGSSGRSPVAKRTTRVRGDRVAIPTTARLRGRRIFAIWKDEIVVGRFQVKVR